MSFPTLFNTDKTEPETLADELFSNEQMGYSSNYLRFDEAAAYSTRVTTYFDTIEGVMPWVRDDDVTMTDYADMQNRIDSIENWQTVINNQNANTNALITELLQRIERLERMIYK